ncbi:hypothetical protein [Agrococcus lahaulensis]|uniref:hypothetical protein n=1 Tax=Agrococcus lahaulensis TaxID=341722 RepID=UPI00047C2BE5|nr:hypothetical protein [Agrococcus lahaulensis]
MRYIQFLLLMIVMIGSFVVMGSAAQFEGFEGIVFSAGLLAFCLVVLIAVEIGRRGLRQR